jgi:hypothetical protein
MYGAIFSIAYPTKLQLIDNGVRGLQLIDNGYRGVELIDDGTRTTKLV